MIFISILGLQTKNLILKMSVNKTNKQHNTAHLQNMKWWKLYCLCKKTEIFLIISILMYYNQLLLSVELADYFVGQHTESVFFPPVLNHTWQYIEYISGQCPYTVLIKNWYTFIVGAIRSEWLIQQTRKTRS